MQMFYILTDGETIQVYLSKLLTLCTLMHGNYILFIEKNKEEKTTPKIFLILRSQWKKRIHCHGTH